MDGAFASSSHANHTEAAIVRALRASGDMTLSLVAEIAGTVVGHIAFFAGRHRCAHGDWFGLGPLAVDPVYQGQGAGSALVSHGLADLHTNGAAGCVVLGDPRFYGRFGFMSDGALRYGDLPTRYIQRIVFAGGAPSGEIHYAPAFDLAG
ncbi:hypothetical protein AUC70_11095 [Methyloceanibacter stevinii]|uniref:N-acetyltransferase domain-containing protein n=1 Tax=Methyloceanibacter stevinii TaxID=1774970 RepID=A0A1E3VKP8_9HYPH|nr:N-acetyltransferase [Methyloceanibacter stevinii]ODR94105.1 hypothetical protein AUC70_11095 [Methyloceanibacter stevinii]